MTMLLLTTLLDRLKMLLSLINMSSALLKVIRVMITVRIDEIIAGKITTRSRNKINLRTHSLTKLRKLKGHQVLEAVSDSQKKLIRSQSPLIRMNIGKQKQKRRQLISQHLLKNELNN